MCPLDPAIAARRIRDYRAARSPRDDRIDFIGVGRDGPERGRNLRSAGVHEGTGRGTVAHRKERPNRPRKRSRNTLTSRRTLAANNSGASSQPRSSPQKSVFADRADGPQIEQGRKHPQATKSAEATLDTKGSFREGTHDLIRMVLGFRTAFQRLEGTPDRFFGISGRDFQCQLCRGCRPFCWVRILRRRSTMSAAGSPLLTGLAAGR